MTRGFFLKKGPKTGGCGSYCGAGLVWILVKIVLTKTTVEITTISPADHRLTPGAKVARSRRSDGLTPDCIHIAGFRH